MTLALTVVIVVYLMFLTLLFIGWFRKQNHKHPASALKISVIIPVRNEEANIDELTESLFRQRYTNYEVLVVDDHSEDGTVARFAALAGQRLKILANTGVGKKNAIMTGIENATGEVIVTTDADCVFSEGWLQEIATSFDDKIEMLIGAVRFPNQNSVLRNLQQIELSSVIGSGVSLANLNRPVMCNGANLAYRRNAFIAVGGFQGNIHIPSGDDEFLMRKFVNRYGVHAIRPMPIAGTLVTTLPPSSLAAFLSQRLRWASKWRFNESKIARLIAMMVLVFQVAWIVALTTLIFHPTISMAVVVSAKIFTEASLLFVYCRGLKMNLNLFSFLMLQVLYPLYVIYVGIYGQLAEYQWKGRNYRK